MGIFKFYPMKRNVTIASTGIAAVGLAIFATFMVSNESNSKYQVTNGKFDAISRMDEEGSKGAANWWFDRVKDENGNLNIVEMRDADIRAHQAILNSQIQSSVQTQSWVELGPDNVGGRTRALLMDNANNQHFFAGGVSGGLWESNDGCNSWHRCDGYWNLPGVNMNVASIGQAPNGDIYVGTGEGMYYFLGNGAGGFLGGGIYKSVDNGATFTLCPGTSPTANSETSAWAAVNKIIVDPNNSSRVYAATNKGLRMSIDGGTTWTQSGNISATADISDVDMNGLGVILATVNGKPWRSSDDGATFASVGTSALGFYNGSASRTELDFAPSNPNYVYAFVAATSGSLAGVYFSSTAGANWTQVAGVGNAQFDPFGTGQGDYDNVVEVDPNNPNVAIFGGVQLWKYTLATASPVAGQWERIAIEFPNSPFVPYYVHSDKHAIVFDPATPGRWFVGSDGGVARTTNDGYTYQSMNDGYNVTQAYAIAIQNTDLERDEAMIGTQDNGTIYINGLGNTLMSGEAVGGGDGAQCEFSLLNPTALFSTVYYGAVSRSNNDGASSADFYDARLAANTSIGSNPAFASFITPIRLWESLADPLSTDSILVNNGWQDQNKHVTDGSAATYTGVVSVPSPVSSPAATIDLASVKFYCGSDSAQSNGVGVLSGDATGTIDVQGNYTITWLQTPAVNRVIRVHFTVTYAAGSIFTMNSNVSGRIFYYTLGSTLFAGDAIKIQDPIQSRLAVGYTGNNGIWVIKRPLDFSTNPFWYKIGGTGTLPNSFSGEASCMAWSADGDKLYVGTANGAVFRFSNISQIVDKYNGDLDSAGAANMVTTCTQIFGSSQYITSIDCDPNDANRVLVSLGKYGSTNYLYMSTTATTAPFASNTSNFTAKGGTNSSTNLAGQGAVPVYSACFDKYTPGRVIIGSEHGIFETANINAAAGSLVWTYSGNPVMGTVACDMIRQQRWEPWHVPNSGCFYAGTHGRGAWRDDSSWQQPTSIGENTPGTNNGSAANNDLRVFPNPVIENSNVSFMLPVGGDASVEIYDLTGKLVSTQNYEQLPAGSNTVQFNTQNLVKGTYIISVNQKDAKIGTGRFLKMN